VTKLFVGNLPASATDASVRSLFSAHGSVDSVAVIIDRATGKPRGFGFVEIAAADAVQAIAALHGSDFEGRALKVSEAQDREPAAPMRRGGVRR
jgi:RNA recognition motif-containing protein